MAPTGGKTPKERNGMAIAKNSSPFARCIVVTRIPGMLRSSATLGCNWTTLRPVALRASQTCFTPARVLTSIPMSAS
jgi:hypothetical protein